MAEDEGFYEKDYGSYDGNLLYCLGFPGSRRRVPCGSMTQNGSSSQSSVSQSGDSGSSSDHLYTSNLSTGSQSGNLSEVIEKVRSTVVAINVESTASSGAGFFFGGEQTVQSAGSGVILSEDGYIVTNNHVIEDDQQHHRLSPGRQQLPSQAGGYRR